MSERLEFTGERFIPGVKGEIWYEHWHRYHFAAHLTIGRDVLDIACGAGYGSAVLARGAKHVVGADISKAAIAHAGDRYASIRNLEFREADCAALPFADAMFDAVVSFETIEHIAQQEAFLAELGRVLRPGGLVVLSCPNKVEYTDKRGVINEFHVRELYRDELASLIAPRFAHTEWYGQRPSFYSAIWPEGEAKCGEIVEVAEETADSPSLGHARPLYFIVTASESAATLASIAPMISVLADRNEWMYCDYEHVTRSLDAAYRRGNALEAELTALRAKHAEATKQRDALEQSIAADGERAAAQHHEIAKRDTLRWWLTLPFERARRAWKRIAGSA